MLDLLAIAGNFLSSQKSRAWEVPQVRKPLGSFLRGVSLIWAVYGKENL